MTPRKPWPWPPGTLEADAPRASHSSKSRLTCSAIRRRRAPRPSAPSREGPTALPGACKLQRDGRGYCRRSRGRKLRPRPAESGLLWPRLRSSRGNRCTDPPKLGVGNWPVALVTRGLERRGSLRDIPQSGAVRPGAPQFNVKQSAGPWALEGRAHFLLPFKQP